jgi:hypothetical protein
MIHIETVELPEGIRAIAHRDDGAVVVCVSPDLSARERLTAIRQALRAAPAAGWRAPRSPILFPALLGSAGLKRAPEGRWTYRTAVAAVVVLVALLVSATVLTGVSVHIGGKPQQDAAAPGQPLLTGPGPAPSQARDSHAPGSSRQPAAGTTPGGSAPGTVPKPGKTTTTSSGGGPAPAASGSPSPGPAPTTPAPQPSTNPAPTPSPSPTKQSGGSGGSGSCVDVLGVTLCV